MSAGCWAETQSNRCQRNKPPSLCCSFCPGGFDDSYKQTTTNQSSYRCETTTFVNPNKEKSTCCQPPSQRGALSPIVGMTAGRPPLYHTAVLTPSLSPGGGACQSQVSRTGTGEINSANDQPQQSTTVAGTGYNLREQSPELRAHVHTSLK